MKEIIWSLFENTGLVMSYLLYKEMDRLGDKDGGDYETPKSPRTGTAIH